MHPTAIAIYPIQSHKMIQDSHTNMITILVLTSHADIVKFFL